MSIDNLKDTKNLIRNVVEGDYSTLTETRHPEVQIMEVAESIVESLSDSTVLRIAAENTWMAHDDPGYGLDLSPADHIRLNLTLDLRRLGMNHFEDLVQARGDTTPAGIG